MSVTRPKKRLIIFDEKPEFREPMLQYWTKLNAVDIVTAEMIDLGALNKDQSKLF